MKFVAPYFALVLVILLGGCSMAGQKAGIRDWEMLTPAAAKSVMASPDSRFTLRLISALESRDFNAYQQLYLVPPEASQELFNLISDMEPGDFVRMESRFIRDGEVAGEMSAWLVVKDEDRIRADSSTISPVPGPQPIPEGTVSTASFALADKLVNYALIMAGGEWKITNVEGFSEEEEEF